MRKEREMRDAREALVALLHNEGDGGIWEHFDRKNSETVADAILAAGWAPPRLVPRRGLVIGHPDIRFRRLVSHGDNRWLGFAPEVSDGYWFDNDEARVLIENHGWGPVGDLAAPGEVTDAEVAAAAAAITKATGLQGVGFVGLAARAALEAAREARNG